ncbi:MAG TPA: hypothetical protein PKM25_14100, partial [Candidatus Ozemobacteraceae bacterium]|nr:hypothetical protein [Candidatus Ozemobacteraceae bacterium]
MRSRGLLKVILVFCLLGGAAVGAAPHKQRETRGRAGEKPGAAVAPAVVSAPEQAADLDASIAALEAKIAVASDSSNLRPALAAALARSASAKAASAGEPDKALLMQTLGEFRRAKEMAPEAPEVWLEYLTYLL